MFCHSPSPQIVCESRVIQHLAVVRNIITYSIGLQVIDIDMSLHTLWSSMFKLYVSIYEILLYLKKDEKPQGIFHYSFYSTYHPKFMSFLGYSRLVCVCGGGVYACI